MLRSWVRELQLPRPGEVHGNVPNTEEGAIGTRRLRCQGSRSPGNPAYVLLLAAELEREHGHGSLSALAERERCPSLERLLGGAQALAGPG